MTDNMQNVPKLGSETGRPLFHYDRRDVEVWPMSESRNESGDQWARALQAITEKCEQYWNEHNICDAEIHAVLEFIHQQARAVATALQEPRGLLHRGAGVSDEALARALRAEWPPHVPRSDEFWLDYAKRVRAALAGDKQ